MKPTTTLSSVAIFALLSACSSGSGSQSFDDLATRGNNLIAKYDDADVTPVSAMPTTGKATYNGVAALSTSSNPAYIAQNAEAVAALRLEANFADSTIDGKIDNVIDYDGERAGGEIQVTNGSISGNTFDADLNGNVNIQGQELNVSGGMDGAFIGANAEAVTGDLTADISGPGGTATLYGIFGAEQ